MKEYPNKEINLSGVQVDDTAQGDWAPGGAGGGEGSGYSSQGSQAPVDCGRPGCQMSALPKMLPGDQVSLQTYFLPFLPFLLHLKVPCASPH